MVNPQVPDFFESLSLASKNPDLDQENNTTGFHKQQCPPQTAKSSRSHQAH